MGHNPLIGLWSYTSKWSEICLLLFIKTRSTLWM